MLPSLIWSNRQRAIRLDLPKIRRIVEAALPLCVGKPRKKEAVLPAEVEITLLGEAAIAKVHGEFLEDPTPTDVITFEHGEILIGVPIAAANARKFRHPADHEVALCAIHGLLHLLGYDDLTEKEKVIMHARQEEILKMALSYAK
ncbi:MAG: rRNA maturation RNase YbeY [Chthoniobacterales bacterium]